MAAKRYSGYNGYKKNDNSNTLDPFSDLSGGLQVIDSPIQLSEPTLNVDSLFSLAKFLDQSKSNRSFPEITVIPDVLRSIGKFVNERRQMKYAHREFEKKLEFLSGGLDKQYHVAMSRIHNETEIRLAQISGDVDVQIKKIDRYYDLEIKKVISTYCLKKHEMDLYYRDIESQRREQSKRFERMLQIASVDRHRIEVAMSEAEAASAFLAQKIYAGTATRDEREHYMELLRFRTESGNLSASVIPRLAALVK